MRDATGRTTDDERPMTPDGGRSSPGLRRSSFVVRRSSAGGRWRGSLLRWAALAPALLALLFPFLVMLSTSMKPPAEVFRHPPAWLPERPAPGNFAAVWSYVPLGRYFLNSMVVAGGATLLNLAMALPAAYALARLRFAGRALLLHVILASQMVSPVVLLLALFRVFKSLHLLDTYASLILPNAAFSLAFSIWLLTGYFGAIPREMEEAALIDGCGRLGALRRVLLPISRPGLVATLIFTFIHAWNEFVFALTFISRREMLPLTTGIYMGFIGRYEIQWHLLMAASLFAVVPVLALFIAIERHLVGGLTAGGIR